MEAFKAHGIVSDVIDKIPNEELSVNLKKYILGKLKI
jgi:hypothetical protein